MRGVGLDHADQAMTVGERIITSLRGRRQGGQDAANDRCQARLDALGRGEDIGV